MSPNCFYVYDRRFPTRKNTINVYWVWPEQIFPRPAGDRGGNTAVEPAFLGKRAEISGSRIWELWETPHASSALLKERLCLPPAPPLPGQWLVWGHQESGILRVSPVLGNQLCRCHTPQHLQNTATLKIDSWFSAQTLRAVFFLWSQEGKCTREKKAEQNTRTPTAQRGDGSPNRRYALTKTAQVEWSFSPMPFLAGRAALTSSQTPELSLLKTQVQSPIPHLPHQHIPALRLPLSVSGIRFLPVSWAQNQLPPWALSIKARRGEK